MMCRSFLAPKREHFAVPFGTLAYVPQKPLVSTEEWIIGINDIPSHKTSTSLRMLYPNLWKVVTKFCDHWLEEKFEVAVKSKNKTNFKTKVVKQVLSMRKFSRLTTVPAALRDLYPNPSSKSHVYVLDLDSFLEHADTHYKVDRAASDERMLANVNDKIRLAGILARSDNRDDTMKLGRGKGTDRADVDGPLGWKDTIFSRFALQMNDPGLILHRPDRATYLVNNERMNPNDISRINIERSHKWVRALHRSIISDYNKAYKKWTKGTGGGSGYPENCSDWNERDAELFSNYASVGKGDYLAWMYMLDAKAGFIFNLVNDPPPSDSVLEDGNTDDAGGKRGANGTDSAKKKRRSPNKTEEVKEMTDGVAESVKAVSKSIAIMSQFIVQKHNPLVRDIKNWMAEMDAASDTIRKLNSAKNDLFMSGLDSLDTRGKAQYNVIEDSIDAGYERLMYAGEMVGKMTRAGSNDEEKEGDDEEDDEDDQAKKKPSE